MKKIVKLIFSFLLILIAPLAVKADMGAPMINSYEARVDNIEGADLYDWNGEKVGLSLDYDTTIEIDGEYLIDDVTFGSYSTDDGFYLIKLDDVAPINEEVDLEEFSLNETGNELYVFGEGVYMYEGPSVVYDKVSEKEIPVGTTLTYDYSDLDGVWARVKYDGKTGWIFTYTYEGLSPYGYTAPVADVLKSSRALAIADVELYSNPTKDTKLEEIFESGEEAEILYSYSRYPHHTYYYVKNDDVSGWISTYFDEPTVATGNDCMWIYSFEDLSVYSKMDDESLNKKVTIPKGEEVKVIYAYTPVSYGENKSWYYVEYNGKNWWVKHNYDFETSEENFTASYSISTYKVIETTKIYTDPNGEVLKEEFEKGIEVSAKYYKYVDGSAWYYVSTEELNGWVPGDNLEYVKTVYQCENPEAEASVPEEDEEEDGITNTSSLNPIQIALLCVGGAVIIGIVALVTIKLVNKKKTSNTQE